LNGIFLLHETYDLNLTAFSLGQVEVPGQKGRILQSDHQVKHFGLFYLSSLINHQIQWKPLNKITDTVIFRLIDQDKSSLKNPTNTVLFMI
jgi:hypothetical protein